jgi:hypothetical protein
MSVKMQKIKVLVRTDKHGSECSDEFEIEADATDEEIEEAAKEVVWNMAEWHWERLA